VWLVEHLIVAPRAWMRSMKCAGCQRGQGLRVHRERAWVLEQEFLLKTCLSDWNRVTAGLNVLHWSSSAIRAFFALLNHACHIGVEQSGDRPIKRRLRRGLPQPEADSWYGP
jgi:hypothetical protein